MSLDGGKIVSYLELDASKYYATMDAAESYAKQFADKTQSVRTRLSALGSTMTEVGSRMTLGVTMPIVAGLGASVKAAVSFESAFAGVKKTVDATDAQYQQLTKDLKEMSTVMPQSASDLAGIMEVAGQLGVKTENLTKFTKTMAMLGDATNLTSEEAASMLAQYANVTSLNLNDIDRLGSTIVALGNNCATTERDIAEMAQRLSGAASIVGLSDAQVMGLSATLSSLGINAEAGGSAVSRTFAKMKQAVLAGGDELKAYAKTAGMSEKAFSAAFGRDPASALDQFAQGLGRINKEGGDVYGILGDLGLGDVRITDTLLRLAGAGNQLANNIKLANGAWQENNALTNEAEQRYDTTESKLSMAKNSIDNLASALGDTMLPLVKNFADKLTELVTGFNGLDDGTKTTITNFLLFAAAIGPATTIIGGLISLCTGPAGIAVATGLAIGGIIALVKSISDAAAAEEAATLAKQYGDIKLSAEEMEAVLNAGFKTPSFDLSEVDSAVSKLGEAKEKVKADSDDLGKTVYLLHMGVDTEKIDNLPTLAQSLVASAQQALNEQQNICKMRVDLLFGSGSATDGTGSESYKELIGNYDEYFGGLQGEMKAKGEELAAAIKTGMENAIDGKLGDEDEKIIQNLRRELNEITARATAMDEQVAADMLMYDASKTGQLSAETLQGLIKRNQELFDAKRQNLELLIEQVKRDQLYANNGKSDAEKIKAVDDATSAYVTQLGGLDADEAVHGYEVYGHQLVEGFTGITKTVNQEMAEITKRARDKALKDSENDETSAAYKLAYADYIAKFVNQSDVLNKASHDFETQKAAFMSSVQQQYDTAKRIADNMGQETPQAVLDVISQYESVIKSADVMDALFKSGEAFTAAWLDALADEAEKKETADKVGDSLEAAVDGATGTPFKPTVELEATFNEAQAAQAAQDAANAATDALNETADAQGEAGEAGGEAYAEGVAEQQGDAEGAGGNLGQAAGDQADTVGTPAMESAANNMGSTFVSTLSTYETAASNAGAGLAGAARGGVTRVAEIRSPSRMMRRLGDQTGQGYVLGLNDHLVGARKAGEMLGKSTESGMKDALQIHSPSKVMEGIATNAANSYQNRFTYLLDKASSVFKNAGKTTTSSYADGVNAVLNQADQKPAQSTASAGTASKKPAGMSEEFWLKTEAGKQEAALAAGSKLQDLKLDRKDGSSASSAAKQKAEAEAKYKAEVDALNKHNQALIDAQNEGYEQRVNQYNDQYAYMMQLIGDRAVWYNDTTLDVETAAIKDRYDALLKAENDAYAALDEQKQKDTKESHNEYLNLLKTQQQEEIDALKKNYDTQQQIALDWIADKQQLIRDQLAADNEADAVERYEQSLSGYQEQIDELTRKMRTTKSARQRRELQKQIDEATKQREQAIKDEQRRLEEQEAQRLIDEYDKLADAIEGGLIGLGDLLGDTSLPTVATGSAGIADIPGLDAGTLEQILSSFVDGITLTPKGETGGNTYQIDLTGSTIRSEDDIDRIVEKIEEKMRSIIRGG